MHCVQKGKSCGINKKVLSFQILIFYRRAHSDPSTLLFFMHFIYCNIEEPKVEQLNRGIFLGKYPFVTVILNSSILSNRVQMNSIT